MPELQMPTDGRVGLNPSYDKQPKSKKIVIEPTKIKPSEGKKP